MILLIAQAGAQGPAVTQAIVQLAEDAEVFLGVIEGRQSAQVQGFVGLGVGIVDAAHAADGIKRVAKGNTRFVGGVLLLDIGIAFTGNAGYPLHVGQRILRLVEQLDAVVEVIADIQHAGVGVLLPAGHGGGVVVELVKGRRGRFLGRAIAIVVREGVFGLKPRQ
ncbi:hypothetical protein D9M71_562160 [compost metagenome]